MTPQGQNADFRVLDDFECEALPDSVELHVVATQRGENEGVGVVSELVCNALGDATAANTSLSSAACLLWLLAYQARWASVQLQMLASELASGAERNGSHPSGSEFLALRDFTAVLDHWALALKHTQHPYVQHQEGVRRFGELVRTFEAALAAHLQTAQANQESNAAVHSCLTDAGTEFLSLYVMLCRDIETLVATHPHTTLQT